MTEIFKKLFFLTIFFITLLYFNQSLAHVLHYQKLNFSASDHVEKLTPKFKMNELSSMFFTTLINTQQFRFNYGRKASQDRLKDLVINVPILNKNEIFNINNIDLDLIEKIVSSRNYAFNLDKSS